MSNNMDKIYEAFSEIDKVNSSNEETVKIWFENFEIEPEKLVAIVDSLVIPLMASALDAGHPEMLLELLGIFCFQAGFLVGMNRGHGA